MVMLGTNDLLQGRTPAAVGEDMGRFLEGLTLERQNILLIAPPPMAPGGMGAGPGARWGLPGIGPVL